MKRSKEFQTIFDECMEWAEQLPIRRRASLYLALAEFCGDPHQSADFRARAADLNAIDRRCKQLQLAIALEGEK